MSLAPPLSTPLALERVAHVAEALLACVEPTFGVAGKDRWIRNARNQIVITNSGEAVLRAVTVDHPVATYLREVITTHAERHGDGAVSTLAMVTAGVRRVAELCGGDDTAISRRKRASLARALSRVADGALRTTLLPLAIDAATVRVPIPGFEMEDDAASVNGPKHEESAGWEPSDRFHAGLRAAAATSLAGAAAPATRAALAKLAVALVANTVREASRKNDRPGTKLASLRDALRDLRARPPVVAARGASVEASALLRGVLCEGSLARVATRRREDASSRSVDAEAPRGVDAPARVVALRGTELDNPFFGDERESFFSAKAVALAHFGTALTNRGTDDGTDATGDEPEPAREEARAFAARTRADVLAARGVDLVVSATRVSRCAASALADRGVFALELVSARDFAAVLAALQIAPARANTTRALAECDVGVAAGGFREIAAAGPGGNPNETFTHVRTETSFVAVCRGFGAETAAAHAVATRRAVRVAARAVVVTASGASLRLVPGGGACEAALFAAARAVFPADEVSAETGSDGVTVPDDASRERESDANALDVVRAMARAVPDALAGAGRDDRVDRVVFSGAGDGSVSRSSRRGGAMDVLAAATNARDARVTALSSSRETERNRETEKLGSRSVPSRETAETREKKTNRDEETVPSLRCRRATLVGLVSAAVAPETAHPGTAAAILDEAPPPHATRAFRDELGVSSERTTYALAKADPVAFAVLEPAETKRAALVAVVEAVAQTTRVEQIVRARALDSPARAALLHRRRRRQGERHETSWEDDSSDDSSSRGEDERRSEDESSDDSW